MKMRQMRNRNMAMNASYYGWPTRKKARCSQPVVGCFRCTRFHFFDVHGRWPTGWEAEDHQAMLLQMENALVEAKHPEYTKEVTGYNKYYKTQDTFTLLTEAGNAYVFNTIKEQCLGKETVA